MWKRCSIVMLPTEKATASIGKDLINTLYLFTINFEPQHLHITSDEEIKEGDWFLNITKNTIHQCNEVNNNICSGLNHGEYHGKFECRKIIASTDSNLMLRFNDGSGFYTCPQPSQEFIDKCISEYNKGNIIADVMVEYDEEPTNDGNADKYTTLHINPDNAINIIGIKDSWDRKEMQNLLIKAMGDAVKINNLILKNNVFTFNNRFN